MKLALGRANAAQKVAWPYGTTAAPLNANFFGVCHMDDGTFYRDTSWIENAECEKWFRKFMFRLLLAVTLFVSGMATEHFIESRSKETASIKKEICEIEAMPEPTAAQKLSAKRNAKRISTEYLQKRKVATK